MTIPLFDAAPAVHVRSVRDMVMAGLVAQVDGGDIVYLSDDWARANPDLPEGHAETLREWVESGRLRLGAPVTARLGTGAHPARLLIGPFDSVAPLFTDEEAEPA